MATTHLLVSAYVAPRTSIDAADAPEAVVLTAADLALGYKDVSASYLVSSNVARGYMLRFSARTGLARAIEVRGLGAPIEVGVFGAEVPRFGLTPHSDRISLQYRLHLTAEARPGKYAMPVAVAATSL
ncbi:MAG: hypothetical protein V9E93_05300 [Steroidobacteraceae bacterium]|nr:hypothetical protein [Pseudomonadota bacterium]MBP6105574.1 hypothetical protein [Steroidobacteraceae bacterium]MBP7014459.1 hypothetical protein [Steroidobacteraceae bacterium]